MKDAAALNAADSTTTTRKHYSRRRPRTRNHLRNHGVVTSCNPNPVDESPTILSEAWVIENYVPFLMGGTAGLYTCLTVALLILPTQWLIDGGVWVGVLAYSLIFPFQLVTVFVVMYVDQIFKMLMSLETPMFAGPLPVCVQILPMLEYMWVDDIGFFVISGITVVVIAFWSLIPEVIGRWK